MNILKNWKMKSKVAAMNPSKLQEAIMPSSNSVKSVSTADTQMTRFNGIKRKLAKERNLFKNSKD